MGELNVVGTGSSGSEPLWNLQSMERGNHLRWFFDPRRGFPNRGFEIFRRGSGPLEELPLNTLQTQLQIAPLSTSMSFGAVTIQTSAGIIMQANPLAVLVQPFSTMELTFSSSAQFLRLSVTPTAGKTLKVIASRGGVAASTTVVTSRRRFEFCQAVDHVAITGEGFLTLCQFDLRDPNQGWGKVASICLPVSAASYACHHAHHDGTSVGDELEAKSRLPQIPPIISRYVTGPAGATTPRPFLDELRAELLALATGATPPPWTAGVSDPKLENPNHLDYLMLLSLDPYIARLIGLYWIDTEIANIVPPYDHFDYRIDARRSSTGADNAVIAFAEIRRLHRSRDIVHGDLKITSSIAAEQRRDGATYRGDGFSVKVTFTADEISQLTLHGGSEPDAGFLGFRRFFNVTTTFRDGTSTRRRMGPQRGRLLSHGEGNISSIEITGSGTLLLSLLEYHFVRTIIQVSSGLVYHLSTSEPAPSPEAPANLSAWELKGWAATPPPEAAENFNAVGLHWTPDVDHDETGQEVIPPSSLLIAIEWHDFKLAPTQSQPAITGTEPFVMLNEQRPIIAVPATRSPLAPQLNDSTEAARRRKAALQFLITGQSPAATATPQPPVDPVRYIHPRQNDGWYAYQLRTVDLFGRVSSPGNSAVVKLWNRRPPPPPILLNARYLQQDEPALLRTAEEHAWLQSNPSTQGLRVVWDWPPARFRHAPKVLTFKIYGPDIGPHSVSVPDPLQTLSGVITVATAGLNGAITQVAHLTGTITTVEKLGNIAYRLMTNITFSGTGDIFSGSTLHAGSASYHVVGHSTGANVEIWVERLANAPAPSAGAFYLNRSIVTTNTTIERGGAALVGGVLTAGAAQFGVIGLIGRSGFIVQHSPSASSIAPAQGSFSISPFASGSGAAVSLTIISDDPAARTTKVEVNVPIATANSLVGGSLVQGTNSFDIVENTAGDSTNRPRLTVFPTSAQTKPQSGPATLLAQGLMTLEADKALSGLSATGPRKIAGSIELGGTDLPILGTWAAQASSSSAMRTFLLVSYPLSSAAPAVGMSFTYLPSFELIVPVAAQITNASITSVTPTTEASIVRVATDKAGSGWRWFSGGSIEQSSKTFAVVDAEANGTLRARKHGDGSTPATGTFTYKPVNFDDPEAQGEVNVTAVDPNAESEKSNTVKVSAVSRRGPGAVPAPTIALTPPAAGCILAKPADWYGRSEYELSFPGGVGLSYNIYRAMDGAIYAQDRAAREKATQSRTWSGGNTTIPKADLPQRIQTNPQEALIRAAIQQDFTDLDAKIAAWKAATGQNKPQKLSELEAQYRKLRHDSAEVLANLPHVAGAYALLTPTPLNPTGTTVSYLDYLPGRSSNRFFYRVAAVDPAGNNSAMTPSTPAVSPPDVTPPTPPVVSRVVGEDRKIRLMWRVNPADQPQAFVVYRVSSAQDALDVRRMGPPIATVQHTVGSFEKVFSDSSVDGGVDYFYRVASRDQFGRLSSASPSVVGRCYDDSRPAHPNWQATAPGSTANSLKLSWTSTDPNLRSLLQRRQGTSGTWQPISGWLGRGVYTFTDTSRATGSSYQYRLQVLDERMRQNTQFTILSA